MMFKGDKKKAKPEIHEANKAPSIPTSGGAPKVTVRKRWDVGKYVVTLDGGKVLIQQVPITIYSVDNAVIFDQEYAAAIADALLQAS